MPHDLFLSELASVLETDQKIEKWDSLAVISVIALIDEFYNLSVKGTEIESCAGVQDLLKLIEAKTR